MKILVSGGRDYTDEKFISEVLSTFHKETLITTLIHGGARGCDTLCGSWAHANGVTVIKVNADWKKYGKSAGLVRNKTMLDTYKPDEVFIFSGGTGTKHMRDYALSQGYTITEFLLETT